MNRNKTVIAVLMLVSLTIFLPVSAAQHEEKRRYLGVVNGQVRDGRTVEVQRTPGDQILYQAGGTSPVPQKLRIRNAEARSGERGTVNITVKESETIMAINLTLLVDGRRQKISWEAQGMDVLVAVAPTATQVELRSDGPVTLRVPVEFRGSVEVPLEIIGESGGRDNSLSGVVPGN